FTSSSSGNTCPYVKLLAKHYSFSRLLWHIFQITVYFFKTAHTQPITEDEITKTLYDVCRMTPSSQNLSHTHHNQTFPSKPTISAQLKIYVFSFIRSEEHTSELQAH